MNWIFSIIIALIIVHFIRQSLPVKGVENISASQLKSIIHEKDIQFIDVRTPMEFNEYKVKPFKNIPLHTLRQQCEQLNKNKEVVLICRSGSRSLRAARILKRAGFTNLTNVVGGLNRWIR